MSQAADRHTSPTTPSGRLILVDCEARGDSPVTGSLSEFGAVDFTTHGWFHGWLWASVPDPENPRIPLIDFSRGPTPSIQTSQGGQQPVDSTDAVFTSFAQWLRHVSGPNRRPVFVSDNPAFDWQWIAAGFAVAEIDNPFGHSARRIGDFAAGLEGRFNRSSGWKRLRRTRHDHNPVHDALGNAEALAQLLDRACPPQEGVTE